MISQEVQDYLILCNIYKWWTTDIISLAKSHVTMRTFVICYVGKERMHVYTYMHTFTPVALLRIRTSLVSQQNYHVNFR